MKRPFVKIAVAMTVSLSVVLLYSSAVVLLGVGGLVLALLCFLLWKGVPNLEERKKKAFFFLFVLGLTWTGFWGYYKTYTEPVVSLANETVFVSGTIQEQVGSSYGESTIYKVEITAMEGGLRHPFVSRITTPTDLRLGTTFAANVAFTLPENTAYFDRQNYLAANGIFLEGTVTNSEEFYILDIPSKEPFRFRFRNTLFVSLRRVLGDEIAGLPIAMLFGDKSGISAKDNAAYNQSGMAHLVAISASQFTILIAMVTFILRKVGVKRKSLAWMAIVTSGVYFFLIGENPAVFRAAISIVITYIGVLVERKPDALNSLGIAAVSQYLHRPYSLFSASFTLSYAAVLSILIIYPWLKKVIRQRNPHWFKNPYIKIVLSSLLVSLSVNIGTAPLMIFYFRRISLVAPITTLLAEPIILAIMLGSFLICLLWPVFPRSFIMDLLGGMVSIAVKIFDFIAHFFAEIPFSSFYIYGQYLLPLGVFIALVFVWMQFGNNRSKKGLAAILFVTILFQGGHELYHLEDQQLFYLNAEKSNCFLVFSSDKTVLYLKKARPGDGTRMLEMIEKQGLGKIDCLIVADNRSGTLKSAKTVLENAKAEIIIAPDELSVANQEVFPLEDLQFKEEGMSILMEDNSVIVDLGGFPLGVTDGSMFSENGYLLKNTDEIWELYEGESSLGVVEPDSYGMVKVGKKGTKVYIGESE